MHEFYEKARKEPKKYEKLLIERLKSLESDFKFLSLWLVVFINTIPIIYTMIRHLSFIEIFSLTIIIVIATLIILYEDICMMYDKRNKGDPMNNRRFIKVKFDEVDFHLHTMENPLYENIPLYDLIKECERRGLKYICIVDHWKENTDPYIFLKERELLEQIDSSVRVYLSAEVEILDEQANSPINLEDHKDIIKKLDFLSAAPHLGEFLPNIRRRELPKSKDKFIEYVHEKLLNIAKNSLFKMILHPTGYGLSECVRFGLCKEYSMDNVPEEFMDEFVRNVVHYDKVIQINEPTASNPPKGYEIFIKKIVERKVKLTVGSDTHYLEDCIYGGYRKWPGKTRNAIEVIRRCGGDESLLWIP